MFLRCGFQKSWENTHTVSSYALYNDPNLAHRDQMEDAYFFEERDGDCVFGVLDGHNGQAVVEFVTKNLPSILLENLKEKKGEKEVTETLKETFFEIDEKIQSSIGSSALETGATCTICLVRNEEGSKVLYTANIGDTQAYLYEKEGATNALTEIHRASNSAEKERVKAAGSFISMNRIEGKLEVFRAFGDLKMKAKGVIAEPYVSRVVLNKSSANPLYNVVIACDGLWDFANKEKIDSLVASSFDKTGDVASGLRNLAKTSRSNDNITVMTVQIDASAGDFNMLG